jgi:NADPH:quinone reductase-like Zn-dependent oxidoreductase
MKAARVNATGAPDVIHLEDIAIPSPALGEVLIKVKAAGVGPWDALIRTGSSGLQEPLPLTLGSDLSGVIERVGTNVAYFKPGDEVFGVTNRLFIGAQAEYAIASADMIAFKPKNLTDVEAASVPVVAVTAWQMLFEYGALRAGQSVLIHGGAGNVGAYAVQLARRACVRVIATAGTDDIDFVKRLGASEVIDYQKNRFEDSITDVDVVLDTVGGDVQERSLTVVRPGGILVSIVSPPDVQKTRQRGIRGIFFLAEVTTERLSKIADWVGSGELMTSVGMVLPLEQVMKAHEMLRGSREHPRGKIVLKIA